MDGCILILLLYMLASCHINCPYGVLFMILKWNGIGLLDRSLVTFVFVYCDFKCACDKEVQAMQIRGMLHRAYEKTCIAPYPKQLYQETRTRQLELFAPVQQPPPSFAFHSLFR